jgi:hypothetical protein
MTTVANLPRRVRRKNKQEEENAAILEIFEKPDAPTTSRTPDVVTFDQSRAAMLEWLKTRQATQAKNAKSAASRFYGKTVFSDATQLAANLDVLEWSLRHDILELDEVRGSFTTARVVRQSAEEMRGTAPLPAESRVDKFPLALTQSGKYSNSPIKDLLIIESDTLHSFVTRLAFSKLHEEGFTPNIQRVVGVQYEAGVGLGIRRAAPVVTLLAEPLLEHRTLSAFLTQDSELRARLGLPSQAEVLQHGDDDVFFVGDTETGRRVHDFFCNVMHQILLTLAVVQEQSSSLLVDISLDNLVVQDLQTGPHALYRGDTLLKVNKIMPPLVYRVAGREIEIPNLGFLVKFTFYAHSASKFDFTVFPFAGESIDSARVTFPAARKFFLASVPDIWGETFSWSQYLLDLVLPLGITEYKGFYKSINFNASLDLVLLVNALKLESLWFIHKLAFLRDFVDLETMLHLRYFGSIAKMKYKTVDDNILYTLTQKSPNLVRRGTDGVGRGVITGSLLKPTTYTLATPPRFLSHLLFANASPVRYGETDTHYLFRRWFPLMPAVSLGLANNLSRYTEEQMLDLSDVAQAHGGIEQLRKWLFNDTYRVESLFDRTVTPLSSILAEINRHSASFINQGSQGMIFRTRVRRTVKTRSGADLEQKLPAALKSYRGAQPALKSADGLINSNIISCPEVINELLVSVIVSWLYETGKSPNFIETFSIFTVQYAERVQRRSWRDFFTLRDPRLKDQDDTALLVGAMRDIVVVLLEAFRDQSYVYVDKFLQLVITEATKMTESLPQGVTRTSKMKIKKGGLQASFYQILLTNLRRDFELHHGNYAVILPWAAMLLVSLRFYDEDLPETLVLYVTSRRIFDEVETPDRVAPYTAIQNPSEIVAEEEDEAAEEDATAAGQPQVPDWGATENELEQWYVTNDVAANILAAFDYWLRTVEAKQNLAVMLQLANDEDVHIGGNKAYLITELIDGDMTRFRQFVSKIQRALMTTEGRPFDQIPSFDEYVTNAVAQITFSLAIFHEYFNGMHGDLHPGNIFLKYCDATTYYDGLPLTEHRHFHYVVGGRTYRLPNMGFIVKIADMGHATISLTRDLAPPEPFDVVEIVPEPNINRRIIHKQVVSKDWKNLQRSVVGIFTYLSELFKARSWLLPSLNVADIANAMLKGEWIRDSGFFYEAFDLTTLFNNMQADKDLYSSSMVSAWVSFEVASEKQKFGGTTATFFNRFWPNTYWNFWRGASVSIYLPRTTNNVVTPRLLIDHLFALYAVDQAGEQTRARMIRLLGELQIYGARAERTPRCCLCRSDAAIEECATGRHFCGVTCQREYQLFHTARSCSGCARADARLVCPRANAFFCREKCRRSFLDARDCGGARAAMDTWRGL